MEPHTLNQNKVIEEPGPLSWHHCSPIGSSRLGGARPRTGYNALWITSSTSWFVRPGRAGAVSGKWLKTHPWRDGRKERELRFWNSCGWRTSMFKGRKEGVAAPKSGGSQGGCRVPGGVSRPSCLAMRLDTPSQDACGREVGGSWWERAWTLMAELRTEYGRWDIWRHDGRWLEQWIRDTSSTMRLHGGGEVLIMRVVPMTEDWWTREKLSIFI